MVRDGKQRFSFLEELFLCTQVRLVLGINRKIITVTSIKEGLLSGTETCPQRIVLTAGRSRSALPLFHQITEGSRSFTPVGGILQRLGTSNNLFLHALGLALTLIKFREVLTATAVKLRTGCRETLPEFVLSALIEARTPALHLLPFFEEIAKQLT